MRITAKDIVILHEDEDIIVCIKPAGVPCQPDKSHDADMLNMLMSRVAENDRKHGLRRKLPDIYPVHRLDRPVGGVMVYAKSQKAAAALGNQFKEHTNDKRYYCVVTGYRGNGTGHTCGLLTDYIKKLPYENTSVKTTASDDDGERAELNYKLLDTKEISGDVCSLIDVELYTGRHHQIRLQMTDISDGIWGDTKYNRAFAERKGWYDVALFSYELAFDHPATGRRVSYRVSPTSSIFGYFNLSGD